ncbi:hypothetical protein [Bosea sp. 685]|uniref:aldose epimerase family protein n=1 Tax=Bosea sp. 685 TaxID=3080057 RepID=UPI0028933B96|nr:hypothetical protein [Bosea sp. 685]WNJ88028.1 hypothetical protein RMR04_00330 [Bosea sp. 685]
MMGDVTLRAGKLRLVLRPSWGGRVVSFDHDVFGDILVPITDTSFEPEAWPRGGAYPMLPFHNRVRLGRFDFGRAGHLPVHPDAWPNALHGMANRGCWNAESVHVDRARLLWAHEANSAWPWRFSAEQRFELEPGRLTVALAIRNEDTYEMPGGLGWHPYFPTSFTHRTDASTIWPIDGDYLPLGHSEKVVAPLRQATAYLSSWTKVELSHPTMSVMLTASGLDHLVLHAPGSAYICIEPVSHLAGALNEPQRRPGAEEGGMTRIQPAQSLQAQIRLEIG